MIYKDQDGTRAYAGPLLHYLLRTPGKNHDGTAKPVMPNGGRARFLGGRGFGVPIGTSAADQQLAEQMLLANNAKLLNASTTKPINKTTLHVTLAYDRGQTPSDDDMLRAASKMADKIQMGGDNYPYVVVRHLDTDHPHAHVVFSTRHTKTGHVAPSFQRRYRGWNFAVEHDREMRDAHGIPIPPTLQWREDRAQAVLNNDHEGLRKLLFKEGKSELDGRPTVNNAIVKRTAVDQAAAYGGKFEEKLAAHREEWVKANNLFRLRHTPDTEVMAYTTAEIYRRESQIIGIAKKMAGRDGFAVDPKVRDEVIREMKLSPEQTKDLHYSTRPNAFTITTGFSGSGKSYSNKAWRKVMEGSGYDIRGTSTSNNVIQQMQRDGYRAATLWKTLHEIEAYERAERRYQQQLANGKTPKKPRPVCPWGPKTAIAIEEAFQTSDQDLERLMKHATRHGAKVKVVMDDQQTAAVNRCGTLSVLAAKHGSSKLTENRRNPAEADTWEKMRSGRKKDWEQVVDDLEKLNSLKWDKSKDASIEHFVKDYMDDVRQHPDKPRQGVAMRNAETGILNDKIQQAMQAEGLLGPGHVMKTWRGEIPFHVGDRVRLRQNSPDENQKRRGATNGAYGKIESISDGPDGRHNIVLDIDRKPKEQPRKFNLRIGSGDGMINRLDRGYVTTNWGVQGISTGKTFAMQDPMNARFSTYVGDTRHRKAGGLSMYINESDTPTKQELVDQLRHGEQKKSAHSLMMDDAEFARMKREPWTKPPPPSFPKSPQQTPPQPSPPPPTPQQPPRPVHNPPAGPVQQPPPPVHQPPPPVQQPSPPPRPTQFAPQPMPQFAPQPMPRFTSQPMPQFTPQPMRPPAQQPPQRPEAPSSRPPQPQPPPPQPQAPQPPRPSPADQQNQNLFGASTPAPPGHDSGRSRGPRL